jgi:hypothetical protein
MFEMGADRWRAFVPEGQANSSQARSAWVAMQRVPRPGYLFSVSHTARRARPKGPENLAQGSPWVRPNIRFALKGLEMRTRSGSKVRNRFSPYLVAPSGLIRVGGDFPG